MLNRRDERPARRAATGDLVLEVVHGPRAGSRMRLEPDHPLRIGHDYDNDVVLRHPSLAGARVRVSLGEGGVHVEVEAGAIALFGVTVEAGRSVALPRWVPFSIGDAMLAAGPDEPGAWRACRRLARESAAARLRPPVTAGGSGRPGLPAPASADAPTGTRARVMRLWPVVAALSALPVLAVAGWLVVQPAAPRATTPAAATASVDALRGWLAAEGFGQLRVSAQPSGPPRVDGLVDRDEDRARLSAGLAAAGIGASLDLTSGEQLSRQVADVLRLNGTRAEVRHIGRGVVHMKLHEADDARRERAEAAVRRDVRGLAGLTVERGEAVASRATAAAELPVDPGKRVVTVVYGRGGYVVTVDGARYFEGALLPSGHRIARIADGAVELERDGRSSRLVL
jgi:type III secretion protein D